MEFNLDKDGNLVIKNLKFDRKGRPSVSGKTLVNYSTNGNKTVVIDGKPYKCGINIYSEKE